MKKKPPPLPTLPISQQWHGETGFRLGDFTESDMRLLAAGELPEWLPRTARSLLKAQEKYTIRFEEQDPDVRAEAS